MLSCAFGLTDAWVRNCESKMMTETEMNQVASEIGISPASVNVGHWPGHCTLRTQIELSLGVAMLLGGLPTAFIRILQIDENRKILFPEWFVWPMLTIYFLLFVTCQFTNIDVLPALLVWPLIASHFVATIYYLGCAFPKQTDWFGWLNPLMAIACWAILFQFMPYTSRIYLWNPYAA